MEQDTIYTLLPVQKGQAYKSVSGEGQIMVKVRAMAGTEKRGVVLLTDEVNDAPAFILNVLKQWDGVGTLQYVIAYRKDLELENSRLRLPKWTDIK